MKAFLIMMGKVIQHNDQLVEIIVNEDIEVSVDMVKEYHDLLESMMPVPFGVLVNKIYAYSYTFEAQQLIGTSPKIKAIAIVTYNPTSQISAACIAAIPRTPPWNSSLFNDRDEAIEWLYQQ